MPLQSTLPHQLSKILNIHPLQEHQCLEFSVGRVHRCKNTISPATRAAALRLLNTGSRYFNEGRDISSTLIGLSTLLLCTESHQSQWYRLARKWDFQVWRYSLGRRDSPATKDMGNSEDRSVQGAGASSVLHSDAVHGPVEQTQQAPAEEWRPQREVPGSYPPEERTASPVSETSVCSSSSSGQAVDTSVVSRMVAPRAVEDECGICLLGFFVDVTGGSAREYTAAEKKLYETEYDDERWVWCQGHCGTNYHRDCMDRWIETFDDLFPRCPTCSEFWVY
ncbi:hypothetical protein BDV37DRAFT_286507 [Aspergillus pseudonomiae]|uniref:RING-type domain-containing protein n=1 Tax=Aspergillus pseudonomiae TaxID=1506151 RepID=A0A5N7D460_9EURO|nr:uncharacterized protein BDV37DRAFT_286507 [Aspergillus pseudonomiae]KAE8400633.1 hypothetical protein BDV37DRAFT_286507 [Aspergillus pseudonomiae]